MSLGAVHFLTEYLKTDNIKTAGLVKSECIEEFDNGLPVNKNSSLHSQQELFLSFFVLKSL